MRCHLVPILLVLNAVFLGSVLLAVKYEAADHHLWSVARFGYQLGPSNVVDSQDLERMSGRAKFNTCQVCQNQTLCDEIGEHNIIRSIAYEGTNRRIRRFLDKVHSGERFTVGVIGGSVSAGHGLATHHDAIDDTNMHKKIFNYLVSISPRVEKDHVFVNGAQGGQGTPYFSYCFGEHIPEDPDLILLEVGINDEEHVPWKATYEALLRGLLSLPSRPAVLNLQLFALLFQTMRMGGDLHLPIASQYDVPTISLQYPVVNKIIKNSKEGPKAWFHPEPLWPGGVDLRHIGKKGHEVMATLAIIYLDRTQCRMDAGYYDYESEEVPPNRLLLPSVEEVDEIPRLMVSGAWDEDKVVPDVRPMCYSTNSPKHKLVASRSVGWREWAWKAKHYIVSDEPGSTITFPFTVSLGKLQIVYQRSPSYGFGIIRCWVDDEKERTVELDGYWTHPVHIGDTTIVRDDIPAGDHELNCELTDKTNDPNKGHEFR